MTQKIRGRHRRQSQRAAVMGALPLAIAIGYSSVATAAPQPGTTDEVQPDAQPGTTAESKPDSDKVAPTIERTKQSEPKSYWIAPPPEYNNVPTRELPTYSEYDVEEEAYVAPEPVQIQELHLPTAVDPVAPIEAPEDKLRVGDYISEKPAWMTEEQLEKTNNTAAVAEAQMATFWNSIGVDGTRSDVVAGATIAGAATGGVIGAVGLGIPLAIAAGIPANLPGCLAGTTVVGLAGAALSAPIAGVGGIPAAAIGCGVGAAAATAAASAAAGIPAAIVGGAIGAGIGAVAGAVGGATYEVLNPEINPDTPVEPSPGVSANA
ncbi:MAG: insoluble domain protein [Rhodococcus sp.]|nr:insoluble domain protein [Rhodococcus sp. (in: high G+C Gram-positive bacteria)]